MPGRPNLATVAKLANRGSGLLKLSDVDVKISVENAATVALAKKLNLVAFDSVEGLPIGALLHLPCPTRSIAHRPYSSFAVSEDSSAFR